MEAGVAGGKLGDKRDTVAANAKNTSLSHLFKTVVLVGRAS